MALNLRAGSSFIPGPVYSATFNWGTDVPTGTGVLGLFNPLVNTKSANVLDLSVGGWNTAKSNQVVISIYRASAVTAGTPVLPAKFHEGTSSASVNVLAGGSWTLAEGIKTVSLELGFGGAYQAINLPSEIKLLPGEGIVIVFISESGNQTFMPNGSITWYEL